MRRRFSRGRGRGRGEGDNDAGGAAAPIDAASVFQRMVEAELLPLAGPVRAIEPLETTEVPASFAVLGMGVTGAEGDDGERFLVAFSPVHGGDAALAVLAEAQRLAEEQEFQGQVLAVAPQWSIAARRRLRVLGELPGLRLRALAVSALGDTSGDTTGETSGSSEVDVEHAEAPLRMPAARVADELADGEARDLFLRALSAFEGLAAKHGGAVRGAPSSAELVLMARRVATLRVGEDGGVVLETVLPDRSSARLNRDGLAAEMDRLEGLLRKRLNDRRVRGGDEGLRAQALAPLTEAAGLRDVQAWPVGGSGSGFSSDSSALEVLDLTGVDAEGRPVIAAVRGKLGLPELGEILDAVLALRPALPLLFANATPPLRFGSPRLALVAADLDAAVRRVLAILTFDHVVYELNARRGGEPEVALLGQGTAARERGRPQREGGGGRSRRRRGGRGGRDGRDGREAQAREPRESQEPREPRESREPREPREQAPEGDGGSDSVEEMSLFDLDDEGRSEEGEEADERPRRRRRGRRRGRRSPARTEDSEGSADAPAEDDVDEDEPAPESVAADTDADVDAEGDADADAVAEEFEQAGEDDWAQEREQRRRARLAKTEASPEAEAGAETGSESEIETARVEEAPKRPRKRSVFVAHADRDSIAAAVLLARDVRLVEGFWVYPQEDLMTFFRSVATDLRSETPIYVVGFTARPARDAIQAAALYADRIIWLDHHEWPPEDLEALRSAIGAENVDVQPGSGSSVPAVLADRVRRSRFSDKLVELVTGRFTQHDYERWGRLWWHRLGEIAAQGGERRQAVDPLLSGRPSDLARLAALAELPPHPPEISFVSERDFRVVHFGGYSLVVVPVPDTLDLPLVARVARERFAAQLSLAYSDAEGGGELVVLGGDEGRGKRGIDLGAMVSHLASKHDWIEALRDEDHVARMRVRGLHSQAGRLDEVVAEIAMGRSILEG